MPTAVPTQYTDPTSTRRRICECIDNLGPMTVIELADELDLDISTIRIQAKKSVTDGYLLVSLVKIQTGCGRAQHRYSRTSIDLPVLPTFIGEHQKFADMAPGYVPEARQAAQKQRRGFE
jgi:predicted ArsR family transcriptional regulator